MYNLLTPENAREIYNNALALYEGEARKKCDLERKQINKDIDEFIKPVINGCIIIFFIMYAGYFFKFNFF